MARNDVERAAADRAGGPEQGDGRGSRQNRPRTSAATGSVGSSASMRSSTPPCPGSSPPLSFTPAWRLSQTRTGRPRSTVRRSAAMIASTPRNPRPGPNASTSRSAPARRQAQARCDHAGPRGADHALPGLAGADARARACAARSAPREVRGDVGDPDQRQRRQQPNAPCAQQTHEAEPGGARSTGQAPRQPARQALRRRLA